MADTSSLHCNIKKRKPVVDAPKKNIHYIPVRRALRISRLRDECNQRERSEHERRRRRRGVCGRKAKINLDYYLKRHLNQERRIKKKKKKCRRRGRERNAQKHV